MLKLIAFFCLFTLSVQAAYRKATRTKTHDCAFLSPEDRIIIISKARELQKMCPYGRFILYALGNSPAYIVETLRIFEEEQEVSKNRCHLIAFSGNWLKNDKGAFSLYRSSAPCKEEIAAFREYLQTIGLSPHAIIKRFRHGIQIGLVEFIETGAGLASFMSMMDHWAEELGYSLDEFNKAIVIINLSSSEKPLEHFYTILTTNTPIEKMLFPSKQDVPMKIHDLQFAPASKEEELLHRCINIDNPNERLTPQHKHNCWCTQNPLHYQKSTIAQRFLNLIKNDIENDPNLAPLSLQKRTEN